MTWKELKEALERLGLKDEDTVWYIDVTFPTFDDLRVDHPKGSESLGAAVSNF